MRLDEQETPKVMKKWFVIYYDNALSHTAYFVGDFLGKKTSVCTGTRSRSKTSLNTVVHENIKIYEPVCEIFVEISLNFFKNCPQLIFL